MKITSTRGAVLGVCFLLLQPTLVTSQADAAVHERVNDNSKTYFGDRSSKQYRGKRQKARVGSYANHRNGTRIAEFDNSTHAPPRFDYPATVSEQELEQRIKAIEARQREIEENLKKQVSKPANSGGAFPAPRSNSVLSKEKRTELEAWKRNVGKTNTKPAPSKRRHKPKSYEQKMQEYKLSRNCFDAARNENGSINAEIARRLGCRDMKRPRRD